MLDPSGKLIQNPTDTVRHFHGENRKHATVTGSPRLVTNRQSSVVLPLPQEDDAFTFAVFGDRTGGTPEGVSVLEQAVKDVNLIEPDLVMTVGDMIQGYNTTESWLPEMRQYKRVMDRLLCPWFPVAGNHDIYWRGDDRPDGEHETNYELHFGPLWYAFEHKNCWFIVLYSDEGNPETGVKSIGDARSQKMSPEQLAWLKETLKKASDAEHVFLFLHHPRWIGGRYGNDWNKVHQALKEAGNVRAVFGGHIHRMRYDGPRDGIEYVTLATVGGSQNGYSEDAGYLHHFHLVTVRRQQIAMACLPVGEVMDVREITGEISEDVERIARTTPSFESIPLIGPGGTGTTPTVVEFANPSSRPIEVELRVESADRRWSASPDHVHQVIHPGEQMRQSMMLRRFAGSESEAYAPPQLVVRADYLTENARLGLKEMRHNIPIRLDLETPERPESERVATFDGDDAVAVDSGLIELPDGPFTLECWMKARTFGSRVGLITKAQGSEYGLFVSNGNPYFTVHLDGAYREADAADTKLETGRWYHVAGVYDGEAVRTYVDGKLISSVEASGSRTTNNLPLMIGADVDGRGGATSFFDGSIDAVRLSRVARYSGDEFKPERRPASDDGTRLLMNFDGFVGPWAYDASPARAHGTRIGDVTLQSAN